MPKAATLEAPVTPADGLQTSAKPALALPEGRRVRKPIPMKGEWPDPDKIDDVWTFLSALEPHQWSTSLPPAERIDVYLYRLDPPCDWAPQSGKNSLVEKWFEYHDETYVQETWGGHKWELIVNRGTGKERENLYRQSFQNAAPPKDIRRILADRIKAQEQSQAGSTPAVAASAPTASSISEITALMAAMERQQERFFAEIQAMRNQMNQLDPMAQAKNIVDAQRQMLVSPVPQVNPMDMTKAVMETAMELAKQFTRSIVPAPPPMDMGQIFQQFMTFSKMFREMDNELRPPVPSAEPESVALAITREIVAGAPKVIEGINEGIKRTANLEQIRAATAQSRTIDVPPAAANPAPVPPPAAATQVEAPAAAPDPNLYPKIMIARLIVEYLPGDPDPYEEQGTDAADMVNSVDGDIGEFMAAYFIEAGNENRAAIPELDAIFAPYLSSKHMFQFAKDYIEYFRNPAPDPSPAPA